MPPSPSQKWQCAGLQVEKEGLEDLTGLGGDPWSRRLSDGVEARSQSWKQTDRNCVPLYMCQHSRSNYKPIHRAYFGPCEIRCGYSMVSVLHGSFDLSCFEPISPNHFRFRCVSGLIPL